MPISRVDIWGVRHLLVIISFVGNFKNGVKKNCSKFIAAFTLSFLAEDPHLVVPLLEDVDVVSHLVLHGPEHLLLAPLSGLGVDLAALLIAGLPELAVVNDDVLALLGPPLLVVELLLLLGLALHPLKNLILATLVLHVLVGLHLVDDHLPAASLPVLALPLTDDLLVLGAEACRGQGQCRAVKVDRLGCGLDALGERVRHHRLRLARHRSKPLTFVCCSHGGTLAILDALRNSSFSILLFHLSANTVVSLKSFLKLGDSIINFFGCFVDLGKCQLVILFSFFVFKLELSSFSGLLKSLVLLPILHTLL